jgi:hypothetical protein
MCNKCVPLGFSGNNYKWVPQEITVKNEVPAGIFLLGS